MQDGGICDRMKIVKKGCDRMLDKQPWIFMAPDMMTEWTQCMEEGKDVEKFRVICEEIAKNGTKMENIAREVAEQMGKARRRRDYPYYEPSELAMIVSEKGKKRHQLAPAAPDKDKIRGAWLGRIAGCLLGKPMEGMRRPLLYDVLKTTGNYPMERYVRKAEFTPELEERMGEMWVGRCWADTLDGAAPADDDTNYTVFGLKLVEEYGRDFTAADVMEGWMKYIPYLALCTAERVAYRNAAMGLLPPETATWLNPYREWIGAQIRGDFFGYICPGDPKSAAEMALRDASISHVKNGIYGEMFCTAMTAAAAVTDDIMTIIEAGLDEIPEKCRLRDDVEKVIGWYREGLGREEIIEKIHECWDENTAHGWCHTISNAMIVVMALLTGEGDFGKSVCAAVQAAFDTDCNGATVGSIIGMRNGGIPEEWVAPFGGRLLTSIQDLNDVTVDELVEMTMELME